MGLWDRQDLGRAQWDCVASGGTREFQGLPMVPLGLGDILAGLGIVMANLDMSATLTHSLTALGGGGKSSGLL